MHGEHRIDNTCMETIYQATLVGQTCPREKQHMDHVHVMLLDLFFVLICRTMSILILILILIAL